MPEVVAKVFAYQVNSFDIQGRSRQYWVVGSSELTRLDMQIYARINGDAHDSLHISTQELKRMVRINHYVFVGPKSDDKCLDFVNMSVRLTKLFDSRCSVGDVIWFHETFDVTSVDHQHS
jgi:hypothetical protein